jgi:Domain of unknown function (DUF4410)
MKAIIRFFILTLGISILTSCSSVRVTDQQTYSTSAVRPTIIYVANFDLQTTDIHSETGILGTKIRPLHRVRDLLTGNSDDPDAVALKLVNSMADSIVNDLVKAGFPAQRIDPDASVPTDGWLLRGVFTEVDEGNRLRRALIGFGQGKTDLQVVTAVDNLADGPPRPLYQVQTDATSGNAPGAGPMIVINPASVAVRFVMTRNDLKHNVTQTAAKIANEITKQFRPKS